MRHIEITAPDNSIVTKNTKRTDVKYVTIGYGTNWYDEENNLPAHWQLLGLHKDRVNAEKHVDIFTKYQWTKVRVVKVEPENIKE